MEWMGWKAPAWNTSIDRADRVELYLPDKTILPEEGWPDEFWKYVSDRCPLADDEAERVISLFRALKGGVSARCHMPPWGVAFYEREEFLFTATLCYACSNAYVYTAEGKELRAFDPGAPEAVELRSLLEHYLSIAE